MAEQDGESVDIVVDFSPTEDLLMLTDITDRQKVTLGSFNQTDTVLRYDGTGIVHFQNVTLEVITWENDALRLS